MSTRIQAHSRSTLNQTHTKASSSRAQVGRNQHSLSLKKLLKGAPSSSTSRTSSAAILRPFKREMRSSMRSLFEARTKAHSRSWVRGMQARFQAISCRTLAWATAQKSFRCCACRRLTVTCKQTSPCRSDETKRADSPTARLDFSP